MKRLFNDKIRVIWYSHPRVAIALVLVLINLAIIGLFTGILSLISGGAYFKELAYVFTFTMSSDGIYDFVNSSDDLACFVVKIVLAVIQMVIFSGALIGFTTDILQSTIDRRLNNVGKIRLSGHFVLLNWSSIGPRLVYDLSFLEGHENVIILTEEDRDEVLTSIANVFTENGRRLKGMRIFVKQGDPMSPKHLDDVSLSQARYIGILLSGSAGGGERSGDMPTEDLAAIKTLLTMMNMNTEANIVVECRDPAARTSIEGLVRAAGSGLSRNIIAFSRDAVIGHILGRSIVNPAYDDVYNELLSYDGVEFYGIPAEEVGTALCRYNDCIPVINYDDDDAVDEAGAKAPDHLYVLSDTRDSLGVRSEPRAFLRPLNYREALRAEAFTVFIVSRDAKPSFVLGELDKFAEGNGASLHYKSYSYAEGADALKADLAATEGKKKVLLLSSDGEMNDRDADVFLTALDLKLNAALGGDTEVYAEITNPVNVSALQNLGVVSVIVSNRIVSLFMLQLLTHPNSKKFYRDIISLNDAAQDDGAIDIDIVTAEELLAFDGEDIAFTCQSELVQSFYMASGKRRMCLGIKRGDTIRFLCDGMDKPEDLRLYPTDELILATYGN